MNAAKADLESQKIKVPHDECKIDGDGGISGTKPVTTTQNVELYISQNISTGLLSSSIQEQVSVL